MILTKDATFYKSLIKLSLPLATQNLLVFLSTLSDSLIAGRLGDGAASGVYIGKLPESILIMLLTGIEGGILVGVSRYSGAKDTRSLLKIARIGSAFCIGLGVLFFALGIFIPDKITGIFIGTGGGNEGEEYLRLCSYAFPLLSASGAINAILRSIGRPRGCMVSSFLSLAFRVFFAICLSFGKLFFTKMGILGIAAASIIATVVEFSSLLIFLIITIKSKDLSIHSKSERKDHAYGKPKEFIGYTAPLFFGQVIWVINTFFASYVIAKIDTDAVMAGFSIANTLNAMCYILMNAQSSATSIIFGKYIGEGERQKLHEYTYTVEALFLFLGIFVSLILLFARVPFISLYNVTDEARSAASSMISVLTVTIIGTHYGTACLYGILKGGADVKFILKNDAAMIFGVVIPITLIALRLNAPLPFVFLALKSDQIIKCIVAAVKINRFNWIKPINDISKSSRELGNSEK